MLAITDRLEAGPADGRLGGRPLQGAPTSVPATQPAGKQASSFYPPAILRHARENIHRFKWAAEAGEQIVAAAEPWLKMSDDELWNLMFGPTIRRSWMVWSDGHCPSCKKPVVMYNWEIDAIGRPWKVRCPNCKEIFPKNDFRRFFETGLDEAGVFDPKRADRKLLFNLEHPEPADPLHNFGVDDGDGYIEGQKRWRFIGAYLIYGQWKQAVVAGVRNLAAAYAVTGDPRYAHKAGVLLDRVADLYPTFDFQNQGILYERVFSGGYVSVWHDAAYEVRDLAIGYDQVFDALIRDEELARFSAAKAQQVKVALPKRTPADIQRNIEERILRDTLAHRPKIESNYPQTDMTIALIHTVLDWPRCRPQVMAMIDAMLQRATAVDGVSGEHGMAGYTTIAPRTMSELLGRYLRMDPGVLKDVLARNSRLREAYRFHVDTLCLGKYYPNIGDSRAVGEPLNAYLGVDMTQTCGMSPSGFTFLWGMYELTKDPAFVQALYFNNGSKLDGLPFDLFDADPYAFQRNVREVIAREGAEFKLASVNKPQWCLGILRSGEGPRARAGWLDYNSGGAHAHADGMNIGLFAYGLDLLPDFGYPPVNYGGWGSPRAQWYTSTAAHNTVLVDGANTRGGAGQYTLWAETPSVRVMRASAPGLIGGKQYERTLALMDIDGDDAYMLDVFRVVGGSNHMKLTHSTYSTMSTNGLKLAPADAPLPGVQMRSFRRDASPPAAWTADWKIQDRLKLLPRGSQVHLRYTDLTESSEAWTAESWINAGLFNKPGEAWLPTVLARRTGPAPLASTFVSVIEPYSKAPKIAGIRRLALQTASGAARPGANVCLEAKLADGRRDVIAAADVENPLALPPKRSDDPLLLQPELNFRTDAEFCSVRMDKDGVPQSLILCRGRTLIAGPLKLELQKPADVLAIDIEGGKPVVKSGTPDEVTTLELAGRKLLAK